MHARELVELAAIVSAHGPILVRGGNAISAQNIEQYWTSSKVRLDRWARRLKMYSSRSARAVQGLDQPHAEREEYVWPEARGVLEEVLASEMLTRVWTAVLCAYDRCRGTDDAEPVARSVLIGQMEARHRVLTILSHDSGIDAKAAAALNQLRRRAQRWTDLLVGHLAVMYGVGEFAFDPRRASDFADNWRCRCGLRGSRHTWPLVLASLRAAFHPVLTSQSPNAEVNARIAASILACFSAELFDSTGLLRPLWLMRLTTTADDTQGLIDELFNLDRPAAAEAPAAARLWRRTREK
jgi:hypothetical protein